MKKYRIRVETNLKGEETFYPEFKYDFLHRWKGIINTSYWGTIIDQWSDSPIAYSFERAHELINEIKSKDKSEVKVHYIYK